MEFTANRKPRLTWLELVVVIVLGGLVAGLVVPNIVTRTATTITHEYDSDIDFRSRNFHSLMRRDILLASSMTGPLEFPSAVEVLGDTLIIRFADLDSVRYFLDTEVNSIYREDVPIVDNVLLFDITYDTITVHVTIDVAAQSLHRWVNDGELYNRRYEWVTVLNEFQIRE